MIKKEPNKGEDQTDLIMLTHQTREKRINAAIAKVDALGVVAGKVTMLRLEELGTVLPNNKNFTLITARAFSSLEEIVRFSLPWMALLPVFLPLRSTAQGRLQFVMPGMALLPLM